MPIKQKTLRLMVMAVIVLGSIAFLLHGLYRFDAIHFIVGVGGFLGFDRMNAE